MPDLSSIRGFNDHVQETVRTAVRAGGELRQGGNHLKLVLPSGASFPIHAFRRGYGDGPKDLRKRVYEQMEAEGMTIHPAATSNGYPVRCPRCRAEIGELGNLDAHYATEHPEAASTGPTLAEPGVEIEASSEPVAEVTDELTCPDCGATANSKGVPFPDLPAVKKHRAHVHGVRSTTRSSERNNAARDRRRAQAKASASGRPSAGAVTTSHVEPADKRVSAQRLVAAIEQAADQLVRAAGQLAVLFSEQHEELSDTKARLRKIEQALGKAVDLI